MHKSAILLNKLLNGEVILISGFEYAYREGKFGIVVNDPEGSGKRVLAHRPKFKLSELIELGEVYEEQYKQL